MSGRFTPRYTRRFGDRHEIDGAMTSRVWFVWKEKARVLKRDTYAVYLACRDPRVPWYGRLLAVCIVGYAFSPIDLIPDFVPVLGYLDDLILIPLGIALLLKFIPFEVMAECREKAAFAMAVGKPKNWIAAGIIVAIWLSLAALGIFLVMRVVAT
jgi:uncharacterized membrane protein YkvA (DUF1232 family)